jgi:hypothetical protein
MKRYKVMVLILITSFAFFPVVSSAQMTWTPATYSADWSPRAGHASVVFDGKMWVLGGRFHASSTDSLLNDVWCSTNGEDWTPVTNSALWSPRMGHEVVVFEDTMWLIGGWGVGTVQLNDVWFSTDGANWLWAVDSAPWVARSFHEVVVFNDEIWLIGGYTNVGAVYVNDIWSSPDGVNWTCDTNSAEWQGRCNHQVTNFNGQMWVVAGMGWSYFRDVWYSIDGSSWFCKTDTAEWSYRSKHSTVVFSNKMWVIGGGYWAVHFNDVWFSTDGANWTCADSSAEWQPRRAHTSVVYDNKMWVIGGGYPPGVYCNDVWYSTGLGIEEDNTSITKEHYLGSTIFTGPLLLPEGKECRVFDIMGRVVESSKITRGIYFVEIDNKIVQKIVKVR